MDMIMLSPEHGLQVDASGNKGTCVQTITVLLASLSDIRVPLDWHRSESSKSHA